MILLDTHILLWWVLNSKRLSGSEIKQLNKLSSSKKLSFSVISIWEVEMLDRKKKIQLGENFEQWALNISDPDILHSVPLTEEIVINQRNLPDSFHSDPADRLIVSTAKLLDVPLATKDQRIIDSGVCKIWSFEN